MDSAAAAAELTAIFQRMDVLCEVRDTPESGKHVIATKPIAAGTALFQECPLVSWRFHRDEGSFETGALCDYCMAVMPAAAAANNSADAAPCATCGAVYCCPECATAAAPAHGLLCAALPQLRAFHERLKPKGEAPPPISAEAVARCAVALLLRYAKTAAANPGAAPSEIFPHAARTFDRLLEPPPKVPFEGVDAALWCRTVRVALMSQVREFAAAQCGAAAAEVVEAVLKEATLRTFLGQLTINAQSINAPPPGTPAATGGERKKEAAADAGPTAAACRGTGSRGAGAFVLQSNFNHSCGPNVRIAFGADNEITLVARRAVAAGEELTITYIADFFLALEDFKQRRDRLRPYFFVCGCRRCAEEEAAAKKSEEAAT